MFVLNCIPEALSECIMGKTVTHPTHTHVNKAFVDMVSKCHHEFKCVILLHAAYIKKTVPSRNPASTHRPD